MESKDTAAVSKSLCGLLMAISYSGHLDIYFVGETVVNYNGFSLYSFNAPLGPNTSVEQKI